MNKDQKLLELLYESILNKNELLDEEERFIDQLAKNITKSMYKNFSAPGFFSGTKSLGNIVDSIFLDDLRSGKVFKSLTEDQRQEVMWVFSTKVVYIPYSYLVAVKGDGQPRTVCFKTMDDWKNKIEDREVCIPFENKQEVLEMIKKTITETMLWLYDARKEYTGSVKEWSDWRGKELKNQRVSKALAGSNFDLGALEGF